MTVFIKADDCSCRRDRLAFFFNIKQVQKRQTHEANPGAWTIWGGRKSTESLKEVEFMREDAAIIASLQINDCQWSISTACHKPSPNGAQSKTKEAFKDTFNLKAVIQTLWRRSCTVLVCVCAFGIRHNTESMRICWCVEWMWSSYVERLIDQVALACCTFEAKVTNVKLFTDEPFLFFWNNGQMIAGAQRSHRSETNDGENERALIECQRGAVGHAEPLWDAGSWGAVLPEWAMTFSFPCFCLNDVLGIM